MRYKVIIFSLLIFVLPFYCSIPAHADDDEITIIVNETGKSGHSNGAHVPSISPVSVTYNENSSLFTICFRRSLGMVLFSVEDEYGNQVSSSALDSILSNQVVEVPLIAGLYYVRFELLYNGVEYSGYFLLQ